MSAAPDPTLLRKAADIIEERGLHKGSFVDRAAADEATCAPCTLGALLIAAGAEIRANANSGNFYLWPTAARFARVDSTLNYLEQFVHTQHLPDWNDEPDRTKEDVVRTLRAAADWLHFTARKRS